ncbi:hydroxylamine reductase [Anaerobranca gottschalkii DSM 13577]|uniref:Hydroxylamine reductase n=1 Tax=Anaerobranca gottschalkii DSM 13577 TaxID=1120990 RepID=A0A1H9YQQ8_9FIRM|nr:hydroxylamine reductase [Anaerobranca gottschalkii DSM 13577]
MYKIQKEIVKFVENALFTTLTNVNFDADYHVNLLKESQRIKEELRSRAPEGNYPDEATYNLSGTKEDMLRDSIKAGIMYDQDLDPDIRSLRSTILYGIKGISAYGHQGRYINHHSDQVDDFYFYALESLTNERMNLDDYIRMAMRTGEMAVEVMSILDEANTTKYKNPKMQKVTVTKKKGPFIIVSGHDLRDLEQLLQQSEGKGVNIYTHGEMLPAHGYPELKKYKHFVGNFGSAWQNQQKEFDGIPGCILMTTNCLMKPRDTYKDRLYTTNVVGWDGIKHIELKEDGTKDFTEIINKAIELGGFKEDEKEQEILVGFGHHEILSHAEKIV